MGRKKIAHPGRMAMVAGGCEYGREWWAVKDLKPSTYGLESAALPTELTTIPAWRFSGVWLPARCCRTGPPLRW